MWSKIHAMATQPAGEDLKMDPTDLYREDVVTDRRVGTIRVLVPVKIDGSTDPARTTLYMGEAQMLTPAGVLPLTFPIEARTLADAVAKFGDEAKFAVERAVEELQQLRREAASSIIVPDRMPPGALGSPDVGGPGLAGPGGPSGAGTTTPRCERASRPAQHPGSVGVHWAFATLAPAPIQSRREAPPSDRDPCRLGRRLRWPRPPLAA